MIQARAIATTDSLWNKVLASCDHDFYHLPGYVQLEATRLGGEPLAVLVREADKQALFVAVARELPGELQVLDSPLRDAITPYGYPGPLFNSQGQRDPAFQLAALSAFKDALASQRICTHFVRMHPLLEISRDALKATGDHVDHGKTVWVDLRASEEEIWRGYRKNNRNLIRRLERDGYRTEFSDAADAMDTFNSIYEETMSRIDADESYFFGADYMNGLQEVLGERLKIAFVHHENEIVAGGLFSCIGGLVQYHLSGTREAYLKAGPNRAMLHFVTDWAREQGFERFHLGGGLGSSEDGLFLFKSGFSKNRAVFSTWRVICMRNEYEAIMEKWSKDHPGVTVDTRGFFPPYRNK